MSTIKKLVFDFFNLCNMQPVEIRKGIWQVLITDELAKELDGWRAKGGLFQFTFNRKLAETYGAELISNGSYRLNSIITVIQKQATLTFGTLPHHIFYEPVIRQKILERLTTQNPNCRFYIVNHQLRYGPYFWFILRLTYLAYNKFEEIRKPIIDLVTSKVLNYEFPVEMIEHYLPEKNLRYSRKLSYKRAYKTVQTFLTNDLQFADPTWAKDALVQLEQERKRIDEFFIEQSESSEYENRVKELMTRAKPRIQVRPLRGALLYFPKFEYKIMQVAEKETLLNICYDPVSNQCNSLN